ncbi:MAG: response regulator [Proteobacteria bacterium]|nr:response regulator [Pseudomonadota bacterium]MBU1711300.1 response regulator [Pseudomonadota bacterium]
MIKKILIVDDSPIARQILKKCLPDDRDFALFEAGDGKVGVEKYLEVNPDVTFMDLTMPVMDGVEALAKIKEINPRALVIVSTADIQSKTIGEVAKLGALTVLKKPPSKETVQKALKKAEEQLQ